MKRRVVGLAVVGLAGLVGSTALAAAPTKYDRPGHTERVSLASNGAQASHPVVGTGSGSEAYAQSDVSSNGRYVAFTSTASNLVPHLTAASGTWQVYWRDLRTGATRLVSVASDGTPGLVNSDSPSISADGRYVAFGSSAPNLVPGDAVNTADVFRHDIKNGQTVRVSVGVDGTQAGGDLLTAQRRAALNPSISDDGQRVAFESPTADTERGWYNVFVRDLRTRKTILATVGLDGKPTGGVRDSGISGNGRYAVFTGSTGHVRERTHSRWDVYVRDLTAGKTVLASVASDGTPAQFGPLSCGAGTPAITLPDPVDALIGGEVDGATCGVSETFGTGSGSISYDGRYVTFASNATNLVPNSTCAGPSSLGFCDKVFVRDLRTGQTERVDVDPYGQPRTGMHVSADGRIVSGDGRYVAYGYHKEGAEACAVSASVVPLPLPEAARLDTCGADGLFVYDRIAGSMDNVSRSFTGGEPTPGRCYATDLTATAESALRGVSADGRYVLFLSSAKDLVANDTNDHCDVFLRDRGAALGVGGLAANGKLSVTGSPGFAKTGMLAANGKAATLIPTLANHGAELLGARAVYRAGTNDLFLRIDLTTMPTIVDSAAAPGLLFGMRLSANGVRYEVRAQRLLGPDFDPAGGASFGLFRQDTRTGQYLKVTTIKGGFGTVGDAVVTAVPLSALGLSSGGQLTDVMAFTAIGSYLSGATTVFDSIRLSR